jgi:SAM-dependent methyltransferase
MNLAHRLLCNSSRWRRAVRERILPWVLEDVDLGDSLLEIGPGPGLTTDELRQRHEHVTALEIDPGLAARLADRMAGTNVEVLCVDATRMPLPDDAFTGAIALTMLHHVPSAALQDRLLAEVCRVVAPGGWFAGCDSRLSLPFRFLHLFDTMVVVDPDAFDMRLRAAGFTDVRVDVEQPAFRFRARVP